jgi:hypothetical protein
MTHLLTRAPAGPGEAEHVTESPPDPRPARFEELFTCHHDDVLRYFARRLDFSGEAEFYIGRAAKPGEEYASAGFIDGRGEALAGVKYLNQTRSQAAKLLG